MRNLKKIAVVTFVFMFFASALMVNSDMAYAKSNKHYYGEVNGQTGGFTGPGPDSITVEKAKTFGDDTLVVLTGKIVKQLGHDKYLFEDSTGTVVLDIDNKQWRGLSVSESDTVTIYGEVDKDWSSFEIDVDQIVKNN